MDYATKFSSIFQNNCSIVPNLLDFDTKMPLWDIFWTMILVFWKLLPSKWGKSYCIWTMLQTSPPPPRNQMVRPLSDPLSKFSQTNLNAVNAGKPESP